MMSENPFKQDSREYPIDFSFPFKDKYMINISLPEGYQVETLPKSIAIAMPNKYGSFNYSISNENSQIQLIVALDIATSIISAEDYYTLKEFFKVVIDKENEKIVLKKYSYEKIFLFVFISFNCFAQDYEIDKVTKSQLEQKQHPTDTSAVAAILFKKQLLSLTIPKKMDLVQ